jgi:sugar/nucleoside kinase (ribokinase family)
MSLLVTGSIGIDTVEAPSGKVADTLGGSGVYFSYAASFFSPVRLVGVVGDDCPPGFLKPIRDNPNIDLTGLEIRPGSKTFRWHGRYHQDVNRRDTISVDLNVLSEVGPTIPEQFRDSRYVFLANTHPDLQAELLSQLADPSLVVADTMDLWITSERNSLMHLLERIDGLLLNDSEAKLLTGEQNAVKAGLEIAKMVRSFVVIKKGEHGGLLMVGDGAFAIPAWPNANVVDPTGAGDSFAGGMMGHLAAVDSIDVKTLRRAIAYGTVTASFALEDFSLDRFFGITRDDIEDRLRKFEEVTSF